MVTLRLLQRSGADILILKTYTNLEKLEGTFRVPTSIINPVVRVEGVYSSSSSLRNCNSVYIYEFNRVYKIVNKVFISASLCDLYLHSDVLYNFYDDYKSISALWKRTSKSTYIDSMVADDYVKFKQGYDITYITPTNTPDVTIDQFITDLSLGTRYNILVTTSNAVYDVPMTSQTAVLDSPRKISPNVAGSVKGNTYYLLAEPWAHEVLRALIVDDTKRNFVRVMKAYPVDLILGTTFTGRTDIWIGNGNNIITGTDTMVIATDWQASFIIADFTYTVNDMSYLDKEPYSKYSLWIPYLGWKDIDANNFLNQRIQVIYTIAFSTGEEFIYIYNKTKEALIFTQQVELGTNIPITTTNQREAENARTATLLNGAVGGIGSAIMTMAGIALTATGSGSAAGIPMIAGGVVGATTSAANMVSKYNQIYDTGTSEVTSSNSGLNGKQTVIIRKMSAIPSSSLSDIHSKYGYPSNKSATINDMASSGYGEIEEIYLNSGLTTGNSNMSYFAEVTTYKNQPITNEELKELQYLIKTGLIY